MEGRKKKGSAGRDRGETEGTQKKRTKRKNERGRDSKMFIAK
jgi:hypothetical protein